MVGYWRLRQEDLPNLPHPAELVDPGWDPKVRRKISTYLKRPAFALTYVYAGYSPCRLCGLPNGCAERSDGVFVWPEGLAHYVDAHDVRLPDDFVEHALGTPWTRWWRRIWGT